MTNRTLQRLIHVACRDLSIDQDTRHDLQLQLTGQASMANMSDAQLTQVLEALKAKGFNPNVSVAQGAKGRAPARRADIRYIHVLWGKLAKHGALRKTGRTGLNAFMRESFAAKWGAVPLDVDMLVDTVQIRDMTEGLKAWCRRVGAAL